MESIKKNENPELTILSHRLPFFFIIHENVNMNLPTSHSVFISVGTGYESLFFFTFSIEINSYERIKYKMREICLHLN